LKAFADLIVRVLSVGSDLSTLKEDISKPRKQLAREVNDWG